MGFYLKTGFEKLRISGFGFQVSAQPLAAEGASLIIKPTVESSKRSFSSSPPFAKGDLVGFQQVTEKSLLTPLCQRGELAVQWFRVLIRTLES